MTLQTSGPISFADINTELNRAANTTFGLNASDVRTLLGRPTLGSQISMSDAYGKSNRRTITLNITSNQYSLTLWDYRTGNYLAGRTDFVVNIGGGIVVGSQSTGAFALLTGSGWTSGDTIRINNYGYIVGRGGNGGSHTGSAGGPAISLQWPTQINNLGVIGGGGGGGAGSMGLYAGGGGAGFNAGAGGVSQIGAGGNGLAGSLTNGGAGGDGKGGAGGGPGVAGTNGGYYGGGGGGLGAKGGDGWTSLAYYYGGAAGAAFAGSGYIIWVAGGSIYGAYT